MPSRMILDYYQVLQVDPRAEPEVIQAAYRGLAKKYHPDVYRGADRDERMRAVNEAYGVLGDPVRRAEYDQTRKLHAPSGTAFKTSAGVAPTPQSPSGGTAQPFPPPAEPRRYATGVPPFFHYTSAAGAFFPAISTSSADALVAPAAAPGAGRRAGAGGLLPAMAGDPANGTVPNGLLPFLRWCRFAARHGVAHRGTDHSAPPHRIWGWGRRPLSGLATLAVGEHAPGTLHRPPVFQSGVQSLDDSRRRQQPREWALAGTRGIPGRPGRSIPGASARGSRSPGARACWSLLTPCRGHSRAWEPARRRAAGVPGGKARKPGSPC